MSGMKPSFIYLASQSPRRAQLLAQLGVPHRLLLPDADEDAESLEASVPGETALTYVQRVTLAKLQAARHRLKARRLQVAPILCADTTVVVGRRILGKPTDEADALRMLQCLSGRTHRVITAVAIAQGTRTATSVQTSRVHVATLTPQQRQAYVDSREPFGKAGAYAIQGAFARHVQRVEGSHSGIMGLPLFETSQLLLSLRLPF